MSSERKSGISSHIVSGSMSNFASLISERPSPSTFETAFYGYGQQELKKSKPKPRCHYCKFKGQRLKEC